MVIFQKPVFIFKTFLTVLNKLTKLDRKLPKKNGRYNFTLTVQTYQHNKTIAFQNRKWHNLFDTYFIKYLRLSSNNFSVSCQKEKKHNIRICFNNISNNAIYVDHIGAYIYIHTHIYTSCPKLVNGKYSKHMLESQIMATYAQPLTLILLPVFLLLETSNPLICFSGNPSCLGQARNQEFVKGGAKL